MSENHAPDEAPSSIGRYEVTGTLGFGAMGAVYEAKREGQRAAFKIALPDVLGPDNLQRFRREESVRAVLVRIDSPGGAVGPSQEIYREIGYIDTTDALLARAADVLLEELEPWGEPFMDELLDRLLPLVYRELRRTAQRQEPRGRGGRGVGRHVTDLDRLEGSCRVAKSSSVA